MKYVALILFIATLLAIMLNISNKNTQKLTATADCIAETSKKEAPQLNPYSKEAWNLFSNQCKN